MNKETFEKKLAEEIASKKPKKRNPMVYETTILASRLREAAGMLSLASLSAQGLVPCPIEMVNRLDSMVKELLRLEKEEVRDYEARNL